MIELDKHDVEAVANSRFWRRYGLRLAIGFIGILLLLVGSGMLVIVWPHAVYLPIPLIATLVVGYIWVYRTVTKAMKELVGQWDGSSAPLLHDRR